MKSQQLFEMVKKANELIPCGEVEWLVDEAEEYSVEAAVSMWVSQYWVFLANYVRPVELFDCMEGFEIPEHIEELLQDGVSPEALFGKLEQCGCFEDDPTIIVKPLLRFGFDPDVIARALINSDLPRFRKILEAHGVSARYIFEHCPVSFNRWQSVALFGCHQHEPMPASELIEAIGSQRTADNIELLTELGVNLELMVDALDKECLGSCVEALLDLGYDPEELSKRLSLEDKLYYADILSEHGVDLGVPEHFRW